MNESTCMDHSQAGRGGSKGGGAVREAHRGGGRPGGPPRRADAAQLHCQHHPGNQPTTPASRSRAGSRRHLSLLAFHGHA